MRKVENIEAKLDGTRTSELVEELKKRDGVETTIKIQNILEKNQTDTKVLAASFKNTNQVLKLAEYGINTATCSYEVFEKFIDDNNVNKAVNAFANDFKKIEENKNSWFDYLN